MTTVMYSSNFADSMKEMLTNVIEVPEFETEPRGKKVREVLNAVMVIDNPYENFFFNKVRPIPKKYLAKELLLYFSGRNDLEGFADASSFWNKIANSDNTVNSAYGYLIFNRTNAKWGNQTITQWQWARNSLLRDKDSRQAIIHYNTPEHQNSYMKDFVCTLSNQFFIRNNELHLTTYMRSNDIKFGTYFDFIWNMLLMQCMKLDLSDTYPDLELGKYTHISASLHAYEEDFKILNDSLNHKFVSDELPRINENPIFHPEVIQMSYDHEGEYKYEGNDEFIKWLDENRR